MKLKIKCNTEHQVLYPLRFPCCGNRHHRLVQVRGPSPSQGLAGFLRSMNHRSLLHRHGSGAWCHWPGTLPHTCDISAAHRFKKILSICKHKTQYGCFSSLKFSYVTTRIRELGFQYAGAIWSVSQEVTALAGLTLSSDTDWEMYLTPSSSLCAALLLSFKKLSDWKEEEDNRDKYIS